MKTKTHIQKVRQQYATNADLLINRFGYDAYWNLFLDIGLAFLSVNYTTGDKYYNHFKTSPSYWNWFHNEFKLWEANMLKALAGVQINNDELKMELMVFAHDGFIEQNYQDNFLKHQTIF